MVNKRGISKVGLVGVLGASMIGLNGCGMSDGEMAGLGLGMLAAGSPNGDAASRDAVGLLGQGLYNSGLQGRVAREGRDQINLNGNGGNQTPVIEKEKHRPYWNGRPERFYEGMEWDGCKGILLLYPGGVQFVETNGDGWVSIPYDTIRSVKWWEGKERGLFSHEVDPGIEILCWGGEEFDFIKDEYKGVSVDTDAARSMCGDILRKVNESSK